MNKTKINLSKSLSWLLRHGATKQGLTIDDEGYINIDDILTLETLKKSTLNDIEEIVKENDKQRFNIRKNNETGKLQIRANQGHSINVPNLHLKKIESIKDVPMVVHGTYLKNLNQIKKEGLSKMSRNHIHFSMFDQNEFVASGLRSNAQVLIYIDLGQALNDNFLFYLSSNGVILSPGDVNGFIPSKYFSKIQIL